MRRPHRSRGGRPPKLIAVLAAAAFALAVYSSQRSNMLARRAAREALARARGPARVHTLAALTSSTSALSAGDPLLSSTARSLLAGPSWTPRHRANVTAILNHYTRDSLHLQLGALLSQTSVPSHMCVPTAV